MKELLSATLVDTIREHTSRHAHECIASGVHPHLAVVLVGEDPSSLRYIAIKEKEGLKCGVTVSIYHLEAGEQYEAIEKTISFLASDEEVHGIILQLPLPTQFTENQREALINLIPPQKDVDGLTGHWEDSRLSALSTSELLLSSTLYPPMVSSVVSLLNHYDIHIHNKKVVLVGRGRLVGMPLQTFLGVHSIDAIAVDEDTENIISITSSADVLIAGTGSENLITYQWIKKGCIVLDAAEDVHRQSVDQLAAAVSPSRGGLGPLTVMWLLHNVVSAARNQ